MSREVSAGKAFVEVGLKSKIAAGAKQIQREMAALGAGLRSVGSTMVGVGAGVTAGFGAVLGALSFPVKLAADAEATQAQFETLTGSVEVATMVLANLKKLASETPLGFPEIADAAKKLLAFGGSTDTVTDELRRIGDVASSIGVPIGELAEIYGKSRIQGRLFMEDINQLQGRGINVTSEFAKQFGVAESEIRKLVENGLVNFSHLEQAIVSMTSEGGTAFGGMSRAAKTFWGLMSTLADEVASAMLPVGEALRDFLKPIVANVTTMVSAIGKLSPQLKPFAVGLGVVGVAGVAAGIGLTGLGIALVGLGAIASSITAILALNPVVLAIGAAMAGGAMQAGLYASAIGLVLHSTGNLTPILQAAWSALQQFGEIAGTTFGAISKSLSMGRFDLATKMAMAGMNKALLEGMDQFGKIFNVALDAVIDAYIKTFNALVDMAAKLPFKLMAAVQKMDIGELFPDIDVNVNFAEKLKQARLEFAIVERDIAKLKADEPGGQNPKPKPDTRPKPAPQLDTDSLAATEMTELQRRKQALEEEITVLRLGSDAAELHAMKLAGVRDEELASVAALQKQRREYKALEELRGEAESLKETLRTPLQILQSELAKTAQMVQAGFLTEAEKATADAMARENFQSQQENPSTGGNTIALKESREAQATITRSMRVGMDALQQTANVSAGGAGSAMSEIFANTPIGLEKQQLAEARLMRSDLNRGFGVLASALKPSDVEVVTIG